MTKREMYGAVAAVVITLVVTQVYDYFTDRVSRGQDAATVELVNEVLDKRLKTDSGKTVKEVLSDIHTRTVRTETKIDVLVEAVGALSE